MYIYMYVKINWNYKDILNLEPEQGWVCGFW